MTVELQEFKLIGGKEENAAASSSSIFFFPRIFCWGKDLGIRAKKISGEQI